MSKVKGATHYAVKQFSRGGPVDAPSKTVNTTRNADGSQTYIDPSIPKTELMPSGAQQWTSGKTRTEKMRTLMDASEAHQRPGRGSYDKVDHSLTEAFIDEVTKANMENAVDIGRIKDMSKSKENRR